jgi:hypothetical protein
MLAGKASWISLADHQTSKKSGLTQKQIERPASMMRRQDEQEDLLQTVVGLAVRQQDVRRGSIEMQV